MSDTVNPYDELFEQVKLSGQRLMESIRTTSKEPLQINGNLAICGMGGSGISGDYIKQLADEISDVNVLVNKNYNLPPNVNETWSAVVISYSGNTEETLSAFYQLIDRGIRPVCITSGGKLLDKARELGLQFIKIPTGIQPRAAFPFLFGSVYGLVAEACGLDLPNVEAENRIIEASRNVDISVLSEIIMNLQSKFPIILHPFEVGCVATRFRCQLNENAKTPGATYELPEFSHNGIVGFDGKRGQEQAIFLLRSKFEYTRTSLHLNFYKEEMGTQAGYIHEFSVDADNRFEELLNLTWILDWISIELAKVQELDPAAVPSIKRLKGILKDN